MFLFIRIIAAETHFFSLFFFRRFQTLRQTLRICLAGYQPHAARVERYPVEFLASLDSFEQLFSRIKSYAALNGTFGV